MNIVNSTKTTDDSQNRMNSIHICSFRSDSVSGLIHELTAILSVEETVRINRFIFEKDRITHTISQGMLRYILGTYLNLNPEEIIFRQNEYGKLFISEEQNPENIQFNLSHSGDMIVYAISKGRDVGIDIQKIKDNDSIMDIVDHYFSETEKAAFRSLPDEQKLKGFHSCWTRKEAYIKALGMGLSYPLNSFTMPVTPENSSAVIYDDSETAYSVTDINTSPGYTAAVVVKGNDVSYRHFDWCFSENNAIANSYHRLKTDCRVAVVPRNDIETENINE
jgi:4'-phosphopantetheinyl transferase